MITSPPPPFTLWVIFILNSANKMTTFQSDLSHKENGLQNQFKNPSKEFILTYQSHFLKKLEDVAMLIILIWYTAFMYQIITSCSINMYNHYMTIIFLKESTKEKNWKMLNVINMVLGWRCDFSQPQGRKHILTPCILLIPIQQIFRSWVYLLWYFPNLKLCPRLL